MSVEERQQQFRAQIESLPGINKEPDLLIKENFGFSNSSRVLEGGLFACTNNVETYSRKLLKGVAESSQFVLLCVLTFPPQDEVYYAIIISQDTARVNTGLTKLANQVAAKNAEIAAESVQLKAAGKKEKSLSRINNNTKFYITRNGNLYFENEFRDAVVEADLDPDCLAKIDAIEFAIWPPAVSARRSLLAREFVGYLGSLVGKERVHELTVWPDASALSPEMRRLPHTLDVANIEAAVQNLGGFYPGGEVRRYHGALNFLSRKHFVILSGLSGTGKTQLAVQYARAVHGLSSNEAKDPLLFVCPVRPEWTDPTGVTGYYDVLSNRYMVPRFLEAVLVATAHRDSPVFVVLDEMNLARVEYYFSDVLSCIETPDGEIHLHSNGVPIEGSTGTSIPAALPWPSNLYIAGTINVDETTNPISDKVLDRAIVIDMSEIDLPGFLSDLETREPALKAACAAAEPVLVAVHTLTQEHRLGFGYRVAEEVVRYHAFAVTSLGTVSADVMDQLMVQKILVKLRGADRQRSLLTGLQKVLAGMPKSQDLLARLTADLDEFGSFQTTR
jgi:5-methylcytosine-specific restriction enzyme B